MSDYEAVALVLGTETREDSQCMPQALARSCRMYGCPNPAGACPQHDRHAWGRSTPAPQRIRGRRLQTLRKRQFDKQPICQICLPKGFITLAVIRDHVIPLAEGGTDTDDNTQSLCQSCSDENRIELGQSF